MCRTCTQAWAGSFATNVLSNRLEVEFDESRDVYVILHPDHKEFENPLLVIRRETPVAMSLKQASEFIGNKLILLNPTLREQFKDHLWTDGGQQPPKRG